MPRRLILQAAGKSFSGAGLGEGMRAVLSRLYGDGAMPDELTDLVRPDGPTGMSTLMYALHVLARSGTLGARLFGEDGPLLTVRRSPAAVALSPPAVPRRLLSRFACIRRDAAQIVIESALSPLQIVADDPRVIGLVASAPVELGPEDAADLWDVVARCGVLAGDDDSPPLVMWDFHELLFHSRTRGGRVYGSRGSLRRFAGRVAPLPEAKPPMSEEWVDLAVPHDPLLHPLSELVANRKSVRTYGLPSIGCRELSEFLHRTAREVDGRRPYPAAGRCYELEIYAVVADCDGLAPGLYHYATREHRFYRCDAEPSLLTRMVAHAAATIGSGTPLQVVLIVTARVGRVLWNYEAIGYTLILQDVGVVYQTMYLVAEAMRLGGCALGDVDGTLFQAATGLDFHEEGAVGGFVIGRPAP